MGAIPNGMANMQSLTERYGIAQRAFFVLPLVGMLVDFLNTGIITAFVNITM